MTESPEENTAREIPADPRTRPEETVDALEERLFGETVEQGRDEDDTSEPAFQQDIEPDSVAADEGGHPAGESPD